MARALLIANPAAARNRPLAVRAILETFRTAGWNTELAETSGPGDARVLAARGVEAGMDTVAVFGGDGTTMQAAAALVGTEVALGVIPGGTGNLLAGNLRIPLSPVRATQALLAGKARPFDLGRVEREDGIHYFAVACGAGYDARVMAATPAALKRRWKIAAYIATTFRLMGELRTSRHRISVDGAEFDAEAAMVLVANCGEVIPPFVRLKRGIRPDDGVLDVVVIRASNFRQSVRAVWHLLREVPGGYVAWARGTDVRVVSDPVEPVQLDGEPGGTTPFQATVVPGAICILTQ
ncbi:MAG TPA: diacylglycerol kinase family protein [Gemmatimonadales bacterium]|nr:diacylglycerol kinase family protein [Gemmatimonadales bacterium]